jgi:hypothetical protein
MSEKGQQNSKHLQTPEKVENQKTSPRNEYTDYAPPGWEGWHRPKGLPGYDELARMVAEIRQAVQEWEQAHDLETPAEKLKLLALGRWYRGANASLWEVFKLGQAADHARHNLHYERFLEYAMDLTEEIQFIQEARVKDFGEVFAEYAEEGDQVLAGLARHPHDLAQLIGEGKAKALRAALRRMGWINDRGEFAGRGRKQSQKCFYYLIEKVLRESEMIRLSIKDLHATVKNFLGSTIGTERNAHNLTDISGDIKEFLDNQFDEIKKNLDLQPRKFHKNKGGK